jgi:ketosteroid isomerase-like protein
MEEGHMLGIEGDLTGLVVGVPAYLIAAGAVLQQGTPSAKGSSDPSAEVNAAEAIVKAYVSSYEAKDVRKYLSLFSGEGDFLDYGVQIHAKVRALKAELGQAFARETFQFRVHSHFVSADGRFAALQATYSDLARSGEPVSVPTLAMLEFGEGKIIKEILYYDGSLFKRHFHGA